jgi:hypothetical protein
MTSEYKTVPSHDFPLGRTAEEYGCGPGEMLDRGTN